MRLKADQELRRELLLFSLAKQPDLEAAIQMAAQMEQFVLKGLQADTQADKRAGSVPALAEAGSAADPLDQSRSEVPQAGDVPSDAMNGHGASPSGPGGGSCRPKSANHQRDDASRGTKRRWSKADDELLRRLWHSDHSLGEIAEMLERTTASLYSRARAFGLPKRSTTTAQPSTAVPASHEEQGPVSAKAAEAVASNHKTPCAKPRDAGSAASKAGQAEVKLERYRASEADSRHWPGGPRKGVGGSPGPAHPGSSSVYSAQSGQGEAGVDPIIHFLRSRDYSVVRVEGGRFKLDGRRVLSAGELREKANQVRQTLGQPPFAPQPESVG